MLLISLPLTAIVISTLIETNYEKEGVIYENEVVQTDHGLEKVENLDAKDGSVDVDAKSVA